MARALLAMAQDPFPAGPAARQPGEGRRALIVAEIERLDRLGPRLGNADDDVV
jgi:hypothetical protein